MGLVSGFSTLSKGISQVGLGPGYESKLCFQIHNLGKNLVFRVVNFKAIMNVIKKIDITL